MCALNDVELEWFKEEPFLGMRKWAAIKKCEELKDATDLTIVSSIFIPFEWSLTSSSSSDVFLFFKSKINSTVKYKPLRKVFMAFASETFKTGSSFPDYNYLDKIISAEIKGVTKTSHPALYTWINGNHMDIARQELAKIPDTVTGIPEPSQVKKFVYKDPWN